MQKTNFIRKIPLSFFAILPLIFATPSVNAKTAYQYLESLVGGEKAIGARPAGSEKEKQAAEFIADIWSELGHDVQRQPFKYSNKSGDFDSQNLFIEINGKQDKWLIIGAHYDSTGFGSMGATDNGAGLAVLLALTASISKVESLPFNVRLIAFGAEEVGLQGAKYYAASLSKEDAQTTLGMVNLDTIAGGDNLYVHSAHTKPYSCAKETGTYNSDTHMRDALYKLSGELFADNGHQLHPEYPGFPEGVTGSWSDHSPFACAGIPIAYIEATNFSINGRRGFDGYSQSTNPALWNCFDKDKKSTCDRSKEKKWGNIWHTNNDRLELLNELFPGRVKKQLEINTKLLEQFVTQADKFL